MEGSPRLISRTATLIPVKANPLERDVFLAQAARIKAMYEDKTEKRAMRPTVGPRDSIRERILKVSLFPNIYNHYDM